MGCAVMQQAPPYVLVIISSFSMAKPLFRSFLRDACLHISVFGPASDTFVMTNFFQLCIKDGY